MYLKESMDSPSPVDQFPSEESISEERWPTSTPYTSTPSGSGAMRIVLSLLVFGGIILSAVMVLCIIWQLFRRSRHRVQLAQAGPYNHALITGVTPQLHSTPPMSATSGSERISNVLGPGRDDSSSLPAYAEADGSIARHSGTDNYGDNASDRSSLNSLPPQRSGQLVQNLVSTLRQRRKQSGDEEAGNLIDGITHPTEDERFKSLPIASKFATIPSRKPATRPEKRSGYRAASDSLRSTLAFAIQAEKELERHSPNAIEKLLPVTPDPGLHSRRIIPVARGVATTEYDYNPYMAQTLTRKLLETGFNQVNMESLKLATPKWRGSLEIKKRASMRTNGNRQVSYGSSIHTDEADSSYEEEEQQSVSQTHNVQGLSQTNEDLKNIVEESNDQSTITTANILQDVPTISARRNSQGSVRSESRPPEKNHHRHGAVSIPVSMMKGRSDSTLRQSTRSSSRSPQTVVYITSPTRLDSPTRSSDITLNQLDTISNEDINATEDDNPQTNESLHVPEHVRGRETTREIQSLTQKQRMTRNTPTTSIVSFPDKTVPGAFPDTSDDANNDDTKFYTAPRSAIQQSARKASSRSMFNPYNTFSSVSSTISSLALDAEEEGDIEYRDIESGEVKLKKRGNIFEFLNTS